MPSLRFCCPFGHVCPGRVVARDVAGKYAALQQTSLPATIYLTNCSTYAMHRHTCKSLQGCALTIAKAALADIGGDSAFGNTNGSLIFNADAAFSRLTFSYLLDFQHRRVSCPSGLYVVQLIQCPNHKANGSRD